MTALAETRSRGTFWALLPVGLLALSLAGLGSMAFIAIRDPGFSLERDYYERAVHWDREQAQVRENARLGYELALKFAAPDAPFIELSDRAGNKLHGASVRADAFANARASNIQKLVFSEAADGSYRASLVSPRPGVWEFRFRVEQAGQKPFTSVVRTEIAAQGGPR